MPTARQADKHAVQQERWERLLHLLRLYRLDHQSGIPVVSADCFQSQAMWGILLTIPRLPTLTGGVGVGIETCSRNKGANSNDGADELVTWCFEPSQPQRITSGMRGCGADDDDRK